METGRDDHMDELALAKTSAWLERAVIGLNLCPFAKAVHAKGQVRIAVSAAASAEELLDDFGFELDRLGADDPESTETTLLVASRCVQEFLEFTDVLNRGERVIRKRGLEGVIQLASFHPRYCFAGAGDEDVANFTNRSPYPTLHLLREASIDRALLAFPDPGSIYRANIETLRRLGPQGWAALDVGAPE